MSDSCGSCGHDWEYHQHDGCWYTVKQARPGTNAACPCSASKSYDVQALARDLLLASQDKFTRMILDELDLSRIPHLELRKHIEAARTANSALESALYDVYDIAYDIDGERD